MRPMVCNIRNSKSLDEWTLSLVGMWKHRNGYKCVCKEASLRCFVERQGERCAASTPYGIIQSRGFGWKGWLVDMDCDHITDKEYPWGRPARSFPRLQQERGLRERPTLPQLKALQPTFTQTVQLRVDNGSITFTSKSAIVVASKDEANP